MTAEQSPKFIVEDDVLELAPGQMRKSDFVALVLCALTGEVSAADGRPLTPDNCPSFAFWARFYGNQEAAHIERALCAFIGAQIRVSSAADYVAPLADEVSRRTRSIRDRAAAGK